MSKSYKPIEKQIEILQSRGKHYIELISSISLTMNIYGFVEKTIKYLQQHNNSI